ncbi:hypothetical protein CDAR_227451 [Caerostris darwini]|uniref:Uncharacterized protein n=1 Tax=Caerostris darwini TaxID=1538125 RepID=A0AAV4UN09_9ARAC|nr:hypothetical protein CDAR_227451 [Caerostris darwini]
MKRTRQDAADSKQFDWPSRISLSINFTNPYSLTTTAEEHNYSRGVFCSEESISRFLLRISFVFPHEEMCKLSNYSEDDIRRNHVSYGGMDP